MRDTAHEKLYKLLWDEVPEVRRITSTHGNNTNTMCTSSVLCVASSASSLLYLLFHSCEVLPSLCLLSLSLSICPINCPPPPPQVRASGAFALGTFINGCQDKSNDLALSINQEVGMNLLSLYQDPSPIVRKVGAEKQWKGKGAACV